VIPESTVTVNVAFAVFCAESTTCTPNEALPTEGVVPDSTPDPFKLNPIALSAVAPEVTLQAYPLPEPPVAVNVSPYGLPT
jgi:hypothetical protein